MADEAGKAGKADGAGPVGEVGELPTMPPAPRRDKAALRWATPGPAPAPGREPARRLRPAPSRPEPPRDELTAPVLLPPGPPGRASSPRSGPPEQAADGGEAGGGVGGGRHRRLFAVLVLAGALCALAGLAVVIVWRVGEDKVARSSPPVTSAPRTALAERFDTLLGADASAGRLLQGAVDRACRPAAPQSGPRALLVAEVGRASSLYHQVVVDVKADQAALSKMPDGRVLAADLVRAARSSVQAAGAYRDWLEDLQATGCYSAPTNDIHYREAAAASRAAGRAEQLLRENSPRAP